MPKTVEDMMQMNFAQKLERVLIEYEHRPFVKLIAELHPRRIMEIGIEHGWGAERMVRAGKPDEYHGFDLKIPDGIERKLKKLGAKRVYLHEGDSRVTLLREVSTLPKMDFIYIDGGKDATEDDWRNVQLLIHPNTIIAIDDYCFHEVKCVVDKIKNYDVSLMGLRRFWFLQLPTRTVKAIIRVI